MSDAEGDDPTCLLDDQPITETPYRLGDEFSVYVNGVSRKYRVTEIVERGDRRLTYGEPI
jgi:hypothetical protein